MCADDARLRSCCRSNWRQAVCLTIAGSFICLGILISAQGLHESLSSSSYSYADPWLNIGGLGQIWVLGPTFIMCGIVVTVAALLMRRRAVEKENLQKHESGPDSMGYYPADSDDSPEKQAVPMEPIICIL